VLVVDNLPAVASSEVICANARLLLAELSAVCDGISACMSERGVAPDVSPDV
jgi:hypothetical protein